MPATIVRCSVPRSIDSFISFFEFGTRSAASTRATRRSTFMKSSIEMRVSAAAGAAGAGTAAGAGAGAEAGAAVVLAFGGQSQVGGATDGRADTRENLLARVGHDGTQQDGDEADGLRGVEQHGV